MLQWPCLAFRLRLLPILYSFRRCPYAMRARWALLQAGLMVQWREIELKAKPAAMLEASPKGTVPVLVLADGSVIDESLAIMRWALQKADPCGVLEAEDSALLIEENDRSLKHHLDRFKYTDRYPGALKEDHRQAGLVILRSWSERISRNGWLQADRMALADAALWPFVRQWRLTDAAGFDADPHLAPLREWLMRFLDDPMMERLMQRSDPWLPGGMQPIFPADAIAIPMDQPLFHLALESDWQAAIELGCSSPAGSPTTIRRFERAPLIGLVSWYAGARPSGDGLVLMATDPQFPWWSAQSLGHGPLLDQRNWLRDWRSLSTTLLPKPHPSP